MKIIDSYFHINIWFLIAKIDDENVSETVHLDLVSPRSKLFLKIEFIPCELVERSFSASVRLYFS